MSRSLASRRFCVINRQCARLFRSDSPVGLYMQRGRMWHLRANRAA